jgi:hypothetical protein
MSKRDRNLKGLNVHGNGVPSLNSRGRFIMDPRKTTAASVRKAMVTERNKKIKVTLSNGVER